LASFEYTKNLLVLKYILLVLPYSVLITVILVTLTNSIWDAGDGVGAWTGTAELLENPGFYTILRKSS